MKKLCVAIAVLLFAGLGVRNVEAQAAETESTITVRKLSEEEVAKLKASTGGMQQIEANTEISMPTFETTASYTAHQYSETFGFYEDDTLIATAEAVCVVWHYTDGKVHLYSRTIALNYLSSHYASRSYGSIVNTDGSYSYTTGDRIRITNNLVTRTFALDFFVTSDNADFSCYEV